VSFCIAFHMQCVWSEHLLGELYREARHACTHLSNMLMMVGMHTARGLAGRHALG
jgi:hypothetical protein